MVRDLEQFLSLGDRESADSALTREAKIEILQSTSFIKVQGGLVRMGTDTPLVCRLEKRRWNEAPARELKVAPFWISQIKVTNALFERFNSSHKRPPQSLENDMPVVDVTYGEALSFCKRLNSVTAMDFRLPSEPEWTVAAAPNGWWFAYKEGMDPDLSKAHTYGDSNEHGCAPVLDPRWHPNYLGLDQIGHNVSEFTLGHYRIRDGHWGAKDDGMYCIARGGNWGACPYSARVNRRMIVDVADRNPRVGFRLAHGDS